LSEWSNNMQTFLRYLEQRQDFIATISTEWPTWTDTVYFLRDIIQFFLQQKHLLDKIADSEDLAGHAYNKPQHKRDIRFHIFLCPKRYWDDQVRSLWLRYKQLKANDCIVLYSGKGHEELFLEKDFLINIPGGIDGYHAFYVMIENIIRNAARHSFRKSRKDHVDIVIEILCDPKEQVGINKNGRKYGAFLFRIYDNVSHIRNRSNDDGILLWGRNKEKGINDKLGEPLIDESAKIKKEYWGLSEIKICASYLRWLEIDRLGTSRNSICGDRKYPLRKLAKSGSGTGAIIRAVKSPIGTLGYEFFILKPRQVGIYCKD